MTNELVDLAIFSGRTYPAFAKAICAHLKKAQGKADIFEFANENIFVQYQENIRSRDVFLVQPFIPPVSTSILEMLIMIDAARRASAGRITAVIPYYAYGRSDKKDQPRVPISGRLLANLIETAGADRVLTMNLHAGQIQGFFNIPVDELNALYPVSAYFAGKNMADYTVVATDVGGEKRARDMATRLDLPLALVEKRRIGNTGNTQAMNVIGEVDSRNALLIDEEIDTAGTMVGAVNILREKGAREIVRCRLPPNLQRPRYRPPARRRCPRDRRHRHGPPVPGEDAPEHGDHPHRLPLRRRHRAHPHRSERRRPLPVARASPEALYTVPVEHAVTRDENKVVQNCLRDQHSVEGVAVQLRQRPCAGAVLHGNREFLEALVGDVPGDVESEDIGVG